MNKWNPVSTNPTVEDVYAVVVEGRYKSSARFTKDDGWMVKDVTHWIETPPIPGKFDEWWDGLKISPNGNPDDWRTVGQVTISLNEARQLWDSAEKLILGK